jgi:hypothetical protein
MCDCAGVGEVRRVVNWGCLVYMYILRCLYKGFDQGWSVVAEERVLGHFTA